MIKIGKWLLQIVNIFIVSCIVNVRVLKSAYPISWIWILLTVLFLIINIFPSVFHWRIKTARLRVCADGCELLRLFLDSMVVTIVFHVQQIVSGGALLAQLAGWRAWLFHILFVICLLALVFWNGMIRVYVVSLQLGVKWRVLGAVCGFIPGLNLFMLGKIIRIVSEEVETEDAKIRLNEKRSMEQICATKYPILLVHGVFFRDFRYFNYWGRIPKELETNGATIYYGNHQSAASVSDAGKELAGRIREIVEKNHCEKVNIIAHSKGGLDCRYALSELGISDYVASLTTINTPHRGCEFADYLLGKMGAAAQEQIASAYNAALHKLGDDHPDFLAAVNDLTASACKTLNSSIHDAEGVFYQSVGSKLNVATGGRFPLNLTHKFVKSFDGPNDGLVGEESFPWGEYLGLITVKGKRGISHGDMIDLNRENIKAFDVREYYVQLVADLKQKGY